MYSVPQKHFVFNYGFFNFPIYAKNAKGLYYEFVTVIDVGFGFYILKALKAFTSAHCVISIYLNQRHKCEKNIIICQLP